LRPIFFFILFFGSALLAWSGSEQVILHGRVVDENGKPVAQLEVRIELPETGE